MNDEQKKILVAWLNDAHALEESLVTLLDKQISLTESKPEVKARLEEHKKETERHAEIVANCLKGLDESPSGTKDVMAKLGAQFQGMGLSLTEDTLVKGLHGSYAAEQFEIATYTVLKTATTELDQAQIIDACDEILADEERMADWLMLQLPLAVTEHLQKA